MRGLVWGVPLLVLGLALVAGACAGNGDGEEMRWAEGPIPSPSAAPAGKIAFTSDRDGNDEVYVMNADGSGLARLTSEKAVDKDPVWSPPRRSVPN